VYDVRHLELRFREFEEAFRPLDLLVAYSVKANGNLALLSRLHRLGSGADIVSLGELFRARAAGIPAERIVFAGVGKTRMEMVAALQEGLYGLNVESAGELHLLDEVARELDVRAPVAIRVNPDVLPATPHEYTRTGHAHSKFGVPIDEALELYRWAGTRSSLLVRGIDVHIGSQIVDPEPYSEALSAVLAVVDRLQGEGISLEYIDLGGGYGVKYDGEEEFPLKAFAEAVVAALKGRKLRLVLEPGRYLVGEAGVMLTQVLYVKRSGGKVFVISDGSMTELLRPSHYGGYHLIERVVEDESAPMELVDIVGPVCESGDFLARDRLIRLPQPGDFLAVRTAGAYGFTMASNYNARPRPAEVLVDGEEVVLGRHREKLEDLIRGEVPQDGVPGSLTAPLGGTSSPKRD
jgi:diaminopimelate decarboxylase